jgi:hypothetical protein
MNQKQARTTKPAVPEKKLVQARISEEAFDKLAALADKDTRSMANYVERLLYQHLGIAE